MQLFQTSCTVLTCLYENLTVQVGFCRTKPDNDEDALLATDEESLVVRRWLYGCLQGTSQLNQFVLRVGCTGQILAARKKARSRLLFSRLRMRIRRRTSSLPLETLLLELRGVCFAHGIVLVTVTVT